METMGERIRRLREAHRLTQQQLADRVGLSKAAISAWERGIADNIKLAPLEKLLETLHTDLQYLIHGHGKRAASGTPASGMRRPGGRGDAG